MDRYDFGHQYPTCDHLERRKPDVIVSEDLITKLTQGADVLPLFEESLYKFKHKKNSSLLSNDLLKCRWFEFVKRQQGATKTPFRFPCVNDYHFSKFSVRYEPTETTSNRVNNRYHLRPGPGVDIYGQMPIPDNMHLRKTVDTELSLISAKANAKTKKNS